MDDNSEAAVRAVQWQMAPMVPDDPTVRFRRVGKKAAGALLDGREWREMPV